MAKRIAYRKSNIDYLYHYKHLGSRLATYALTLYYILTNDGFPKTKEEWILFLLLNFAYLGGASISVQGGKRVSG